MEEIGRAIRPKSQSLRVYTASIQYHLDPGHVAMGKVQDTAIAGEYEFKNAGL